MAQSMGKIVLFVMYACVSATRITNSKFLLNQSDRIAPSIEPVTQEAILVITRTVNQGFEEILTFAHP
jgi:hypothetical protein